MSASKGRDAGLRLRSIHRFAHPSTTSKIGNFVGPKTHGSNAIVQHLIQVGCQVVIDIAFPSFELLVKGGVLFVNHLVATEMLSAQGQGLIQGAVPDVHRLARDRKHQIDVDVLEAGLSQNVITTEHHVAAVDTPQPVQQRLIERLHAHGNAIDTELAQEGRFIRRNGRRIALHAELRSVAQAQPMKGRQDRLPLLEGQQRGSSAAEKHRLGSAILGDEF